MPVQRTAAVTLLCLTALPGQETAKPDQFDDFRAAEKMYNQVAAQCPAGDLGVECRVSTWNRLVSVYLQFGETGEAGKLIQKIQQSGLSILGECHSELAVLRSNEGGLELARNNIRPALKHFEAAWKSWTCLEKSDLSLEAVMLNDWGLALLLDGQSRLAVEKLERSRRGFEKTQPLIDRRLRHYAHKPRDRVFVGSGPRCRSPFRERHTVGGATQGTSEPAHGRSHERVRASSGRSRPGSESKENRKRGGGALERVHAPAATGFNHRCQVGGGRRAEPLGLP